MIDDRKLELAAAISLEVGKVRTESIAEVEEAIDLIETYCRQVESAAGFETPLGQLSPDERNTDVLRPYGVFAVIAPFNFPFALGFGMTAGALVAGNAVVLKPPEEAPRSGGAVARLLAEAGVPDGVISLVHGGPATGEALVRRRSTVSPSPARPRSAARSGDGSPRALPEARARGDGRQEPAVVGAQCGPRSRRGGDRESSLRLLGPEVQRLLAGHRRGRGARRARRAARRARPGRRSSAIRPIPTPPPAPS